MSCEIFLLASEVIEVHLRAFVLFYMCTMDCIDMYARLSTKQHSRFYPCKS